MATGSDQDVLDGRFGRLILDETRKRTSSPTLPFGLLVINAGPGCRADSLKRANTGRVETRVKAIPQGERRHGEKSVSNRTTEGQKSRKSKKYELKAIFGYYRMFTPSTRDGPAIVKRRGYSSELRRRHPTLTPTPILFRTKQERELRSVACVVTFQAVQKVSSFRRLALQKQAGQGRGS
jgi:hypothetical protein